MWLQQLSNFAMFCTLLASTASSALAALYLASTTDGRLIGFQVQNRVLGSLGWQGLLLLGGMCAVSMLRSCF
ncbi:hypothetical protein COO60DRAFT_1480857 [Scenedesmus sp. NREL 46B-D3]|nr:hypothetical protein COO60DRAFT_1480857 [Scenedesmus sp. NREL 46B-D3]